MTHSAKILADSISPDGVRLTTLEVTFPRIVLAEFNTHRVLSRNSASSRAIPVEKMIRMVMENPYVPTHWGKNQRGMQADEELREGEQEAAKMLWAEARAKAVTQARALLNLGVHKQITNRLLEPFMWHTVIVTATEWDNFFHLRMHPAAHPEIRLAAELMYAAMGESEPEELMHGMWHRSFVKPDDLVLDPLRTPEDILEDLNKISVGRCARVSYLTHDGKREPAKDIELHDKLLGDGHMSPFEHVARPMTHHEADDGHWIPGDPMPFKGNFRGWVQYRKTLPNEHDVLGAR